MFITRMIGRGLLPTACALALAIAAGQAQAAAVTSLWTGAGGTTDWSNANNWNPPGAPNNGANTYTVLINNDPGTPVAVSVNGNYNISNLTVDADDLLNILSCREAGATDARSRPSGGCRGPRPACRPGERSCRRHTRRWPGR